MIKQELATDDQCKRKFIWRAGYLHSHKESPHRLLIGNNMVQRLDNISAEWSKLTSPMRGRWTSCVSRCDNAETVTTSLTHHSSHDHKKISTKSKWEIVYLKVKQVYSSKMLMLKKKKRHRGIVPDERELRKHNN